jgi:hypothetical protein
MAGRQMQLCFYQPPGSGYTSGSLCNVLAYPKSATISVKHS